MATPRVFRLRLRLPPGHRLAVLLAIGGAAVAGCAGPETGRADRGREPLALIADARADLRFDAVPPFERLGAARRALLAVPGVAGAELEHGSRDVVVLYDSRHADVGQLLAALAAAGTPAHVATR